MVAPAFRKKHGRGATRTHWALYLFPVPALALVVAFLIIPIIQSFQYAVTDWNGYSSTFKNVGLDNFIHAIFNDSLFQNSLVNTLKFTLVVVIVQTLLSLLLAVLLVKQSRLNIVLRSLFFFPTILSSVAVGFIWAFIYDPTFGLAHGMLHAVGLGSLSGSYLGDPQTAIYWVAMAQIWFHAGQLMVVFIAGLQLVPQELYEAAEVDGAGKWVRFRSITWPMIAPATTIVVAYTTIQCFKAFDLILGIAGNPPSPGLDILSTRIYTSFANSQFGFASAESIIFMVVIAIVVLLQRWVLRLTQARD
jgi:raffinose/stachyose/melibiose transport system permease protein